MSGPRLTAELSDPRGAKRASRVAMTVPHAATQATAALHAATKAMTALRAATPPRPRPDPSAKTGHPVARIGRRDVTTDPDVTTEARVRIEARASPGATAP